MVKHVDMDEILAARVVLVQRLESAEGQIEVLRDEIERIRGELNEYDVSIRLLERHQVSSAKTKNGVALEHAKEESGLPHGAQRQYIESAVYAIGRDATSVTAIREYVRAKYNVGLQPNTISVTLSRLKQRGLVRVKGQQWYLATSSSSVDKDDDGWPADNVTTETDF